MLHTQIIGATGPAFPPGPPKALTPGAYLKLRRKAAGLSVDDVATMLAPRFAQRSEAAALVRMLEADGVKARDMYTIERLRRCYPFDPDVYRQIATEGPDNQPRVCLGCGCSEWDACDHGEYGNCAWVAPDSCSSCSGFGR